MVKMWADSELFVFATVVLFAIAARLDEILRYRKFALDLIVIQNACIIFPAKN